MIATFITIVVCMVAAFYCGMLHERSTWVAILQRRAAELRSIAEDHADEVARLPR